MPEHVEPVAPSAFPPPVEPTKEFIGPPTAPPDEQIEVGVAIVGGGPAGLACANRILQLAAEDEELAARLGEVPVAVIEKGKTCGAHNLSGACMRPGPLQDLFPDGVSVRTGEYPGVRFDRAPDYAALARSCHAFGERVEDPALLAAAIARALAATRTGQAAVLDLALAPI